MGGFQETPSRLQLTIDDGWMAWLFAAIGLAVSVFGVVRLVGGEFGFGEIGMAAVVGPGFLGVSFLLRERATFVFDRDAGTLTWSRASWFGSLAKGDVVPLGTIRRARVVGTGGGPGRYETCRCVLDQDPGFIPLTRGEDSNERIQQERAETIQAWLDAGASLDGGA